jgi:hypothetical protein
MTRRRLFCLASKRFLREMNSHTVLVRRTAPLIALALALLASPWASAQILYGSITGTVTDQMGAIIPNVPVTLTNQGTGALRTTVSNGAGVYSILDVLPGAYTLSVAPKGSFGGSSQKDIQIEPNRQVRLDITLKPAGVSAQIIVTEAAPELQTETAEVNSEISQTQLSQMPLTSSQGRSYQALYTLIPGAASVKEQNSTASNPARAMSINANGMSMNGNTTRIDGAVNYYGWLPYLIAYIPPADSIENVSVTTNDFTAEQGQAGGASIKITTKSGGHDFHGEAWEYYQSAGLNARSYLGTVAANTSAIDPNGAVLRNVFNEYGFNVGGPVYIPKVITGRKRLFFFDNWERTTRHQLIGNGVTLTVPDTNMIGGNFSEAAPYATIYDPQPTAAWVNAFTPTAACPTLVYTAGYLNYPCRPSFTSEYGETGNGVNTIPSSRLPSTSAPMVMIANLAPIATTIGTPTSTQLKNFMANDYTGSAPFVYARTTNDAKITYIPNDNTQIFGKYSTEPFQVLDPQELGAAGGGTFDGGQPGAGHGHIQNVGLGVSHVFKASLVMDADFGYTRQVSGAESVLDLADQSYGLDVLKIPGTNLSTNTSDPDYWGQPIMSFNSTFSTIGNSNTANPFFFRDNQFTGDVNLSYVRGKHQFKAGFTYYHFDLNHFQPTTGGGVSNVHGGFLFAGGLTCGGSASSCGSTAYNDLADYLLGLPNSNGTGNAIQKAQQVYDPNSLRWTELGAYAQDQWAVSPKLTVTYGVRFERYPAAYRDHTGISEVYVNRPQSSNVEIGGVMGNPKDAGVDTGYGFFAPRVGFAYRLDNKTVIRTGAGMTVDPDSMRELRDEYPFDLAPNYASVGAGTIAVDPANGNAAMPISGCGVPSSTACYGIPIPVAPNYTSGYVALPVAGSTNAVWPKFRRGYIESWNLFVQRDLGYEFVVNVGYVGDLFVRQQSNVSPYNAAPLPSASTPCMANGQWNTPLTGLTGSCTSFGTSANEIINWQNCAANGWSTCATSAGLYNTGGITMNGPIFSANYNGLQGQVTRNAGKNASIGLVYTYSHAFNYADNGAGTGSSGPPFAYPGYYKMDRAQANQDQKHNVQIWGLSTLPFGYGQKWLNHGLISEIVGGWQVTGQYSYFGGLPFSVTANSNTLNAPGSTLYAELVTPTLQYEHGHNRVFGSTVISGGKPWFNPADFANPTEPAFSTANTTISSPVFANTHRNEFRGPGTGVVNASMFKGFRIYHESEFKLGAEVFNLFNHPYLNLNSPGSTVPSNANVAAGNYGTFGLITAFGPPYSQTGGARSMQFSGKFNF